MHGGVNQDGGTILYQWPEKSLEITHELNAMRKMPWEELREQW